MFYNKYMATQSKKITRKKKYVLSPKEADVIIKEEFLTPLGNKMQKNLIFKPHSPNDGTIKFHIKGDRKEVE